MRVRPCLSGALTPGPVGGGTQGRDVRGGCVPGVVQIPKLLLGLRIETEGVLPALWGREEHCRTLYIEKTYSPFTHIYKHTQRCV